MFKKEETQKLHDILQRIFSLPVTRSTFREIQNGILHVFNKNENKSNEMFQALLSGKVKEGSLTQEENDAMQKLLQDFTVRARLAKDVFEKGEFVNMVSSDMLAQNNVLAFLNRFKRVDGQELQFLTDIDGTIHLLQHFIQRLEELQKSENGKPQLSSRKATLASLQKQLEKLAQ